MFLDGQDLKRKPLAERRAALPQLLANTRVLFSAPLEGPLNSILKAVRKHNLEGVIAKRSDSVYEPGRRSLAWQKLPLKPKQELVIGGYRPQGNALELILVGYYMDPSTRRKLLTILKPLSTARCPFANLPSSHTGHWGEGITAEDMKDYIWLKPEIVAEIKFTEWTSGSVLRHPEFVDLRDDKSAKEVSKES
jgi:bifunctional non-homologous end joining protein LigD